MKFFAPASLSVALGVVAAERLGSNHRGGNSRSAGRDFSNANPCLIEELCRKRSQELGISYFYTGSFPTKGCFSKNDKAFFSPGTDEEMSRSVSGAQERIWCEKERDVSPEDGELVCLTLEECRAKSQDLGMNFYTGEFQTKGCFSKNENAFFSLGSEEEMIATELPGIQERIFCDDIQTTSSIGGMPTIPSVAVDEFACLTQEACKSVSQELGLLFYPGEFKTKGCFSKNGNVFFSPGTEEEMTTTVLPGVQERISCPPVAVDEQNIACLTQEECSAKSQVLGMTFYPGQYTTKGCFSKNGNAFFSIGTVEEMTTSDLTGVKERVWCNGSNTDTENDIEEPSSPTLGPTKTPSATPTQKPTLSPTLKPTQNPTAQPTNVPTKKPVADIVDANGQAAPTVGPTEKPTKRPTPEAPGSRGDDYLVTTSELKPTIKPTQYPTAQPTKVPTKNPVEDIVDMNGKAAPSLRPTKYPTIAPSKASVNQGVSVPKAVSASESNVPNSAVASAFSVGVAVFIGVVASWSF